MVMTVVLLIAAVINICYMIASLLGLRLDVKNTSCAEEITSVKRVRAFIKYFPIFNTAVYIFLIIVSVVCG